MESFPFIVLAFAMFFMFANPFVGAAKAGLEHREQVLMNVTATFWTNDIVFVWLLSLFMGASNTGHGK